MNKIKTVLFVCKYNRFRSKVAEAFFNKLNKNKEYICLSAGLFPGKYPLDGIQREVAKEFGIELKGKPKPITTSLLRETDLIVIVADNVPTELFNNKIYGRKIIIWKVKDVVSHTEVEVRKIIAEIRDKVIKFIKELK